MDQLRKMTPDPSLKQAVVSHFPSTADLLLVGEKAVCVELGAATRILLFALWLPFLAGCPATLYGHLYNASGAELVYLYESGWSQALEPGTTTKVTWKADCIQLTAQGETIEYVSKWPDSATPHVFSSSFQAIINEQFEIEFLDGSTLTPGSCETSRNDRDAA